MAAIFGVRAGDFIRVPVILPGSQAIIDRLDDLLKTNTLFSSTQTGPFAGGPTITAGAKKLLLQLKAEDHPMLVSYLTEHWQRVNQDDRLALFKQLSRTVDPGLMHDMVRSVARTTAADQVLTEHGRSYGREPLTPSDFVAELDSWPSELSKRELIKGYVDQKKHLTQEEGKMISDALDDVEMQAAVWKAVSK